jgi:hypothetical protein
VHHDVKGRVSTGLYVASIGLAFISPYISYAIFVIISVTWFVPDRRLVSQT